MINVILNPQKPYWLPSRLYNSVDFLTLTGLYYFYCLSTRLRSILRLYRSLIASLSQFTSSFFLKWYGTYVSDQHMLHMQILQNVVVTHLKGHCRDCHNCKSQAHSRHSPPMAEGVKMENQSLRSKFVQIFSKCLLHSEKYKLQKFSNDWFVGNR